MLAAQDADQDHAPDENDPPRQWRLLLIGFLALLAIFGLVLLIEHAAGYEGVLNRLRSADPAWLALAIGAEAISFTAFVAAMRGVFAMRGGKTIRYPTAARLVLASLGASRAILGGGPAGIAIFLWGARKTGFARSQAASRVLALYVLQFGVLATGTGCARYRSFSADVALRFRTSLDHYTQTKCLLVSYDPKPLGLF